MLSAMRHAPCHRRSPSTISRCLLLATIVCALLLPSAGSAAASEGDSGALAGQIDQLVGTSAEAWSTRQAPDGQLVDPVKHAMPSYGSPMIAQAIIELGVQSGRSQLVDIGLGALTAQVSHPDNGGFNVVFELLGLIDAVRSNDLLLAGDPRWQARRGELVGFIAKRFAREFKGNPARSPGLSRCMANRRCFYNLKLVAAAAGIDYERGGLATPTAARAAYVVKKPDGGSAEGPAAAIAVLTRAARLTSRDARTSVLPDEEAGLLTDPAGSRSDNPLAYNALCSMMLGHAAQALGYDAAPTSVRAAFMRTAKALVGYMSPSGSLAYIGRGQGQVWVPAAALYALSLAARYTDDAQWRARFLSGAGRLVGTLTTSYAPDLRLGLALVPRMVGRAPSSISYAGIDDYASYKMYEGLALYALRRARETLRQVPAAAGGEIASDRDGSFVDPSRTRFASVRSGEIWYAVHGGDALPDARYDFGVVAAQKLVSGSWVDAMAHRPRTRSRSSAGGAIVIRGRRLLPKATRISATGAGVVTLVGGWSDGSGRLVDAGTRWTFTPVAMGVRMRFVPRSDRLYRFTLWHRAGSRTTVGRRAVTIVEPGGRRQAYSFNRRVVVHRSQARDASAFDRRLRSSLVLLRAHRGRAVTVTIGF